MVTAEMYKNYLSSYGSNLAQVKKNQSDAIMNNSFTADAQYKRVYILTKDGWKWEDAKYQRHAKLSILKDAVDYYLQFRPKVHYPIGSYVFVPDDTDFDINISGHELDNPLSLPDERITQLWFIVGRDDANAFVRYNILKCNWKFQWIYDNKLYKCWGSNRSANSYTSGRWDDQYTSFFERFFIPKWKMIKHFVRLQKFVSEVCPDILISVGQSEKYILPLLYGTRVLVREVHFNSTYRYDTYGNSWIRRLKAKVFSLLDFRLLCKMYDMTFLLTKQDKEENFSKIAYIEYMHNPSTFFVDGLCIY